MSFIDFLNDHIEQLDLYLWLIGNGMFGIVWILELIIDRFDKNRTIPRGQFFEDLKSGLKLKHIVAFSMFPISLAAPILIYMLFGFKRIFQIIVRILVSLSNIQIVKFKKGGTTK